jgi:ABC-type multidrug transport system ATPase subunit
MITCDLQTTTINMLTGQISPTHGDAEIYGYSILTHMDKIREMMGVCPQFDVLWADLTGREHLMLFAGMKGIPWKKLSQEADDRLGVRPRPHTSVHNAIDVLHWPSLTLTSPVPCACL